MLKSDITTIFHAIQFVIIILAFASPFFSAGWMPLIVGLLSTLILQLVCIELTLADRLKEWKG
jgi:uncharacterized membrane protein